MMVTSKHGDGQEPQLGQEQPQHVVGVPEDQVIEAIEPRRGADEGQAQLNFPGAGISWEPQLK